MILWYNASKLKLKIIRLRWKEKNDHTSDSHSETLTVKHSVKPSEEIWVTYKIYYYTLIKYMFKTVNSYILPSQKLV